ncbi:MAG TPA: gamma-glutamyl-gamma-aminobutyrate hydrolase family protein [Candidatus Eremiobacteraceae bacterium]|nr:gamma-glutamyl-gamma-aminobutyrate hydrolase family protein [Candidatus Eremiobacteraceae bacterium]
MKPKIAITVGIDEVSVRDHWATYRNAVEQAGGEPTLLYGKFSPDQIPAIVEGYDGLLLPGGLDLSPDEYGGQPHPTVERSSADRDELELEAARYAKRHGIPTLAICRGCQVVNVAFGGSLYEDIEDLYEAPNRQTVRHQQTPDHGRQETTHPVDVHTNSKLAAIVDSVCIATNSMHHQALRRVAHGLRVVARARDGTIEGVEADDGHPFFLAVQWHPEELVGRDEPSRRLFRSFVEHAAARSRARSAASPSEAP